MKKAAAFLCLALALCLPAAQCPALSGPSIQGLWELLEEGESEAVVAIAEQMEAAMLPSPPQGEQWFSFSAYGYQLLYEALHPEVVFDIIDYEYINVCYLKAFALHELERYPEAIQALTEGLRWDPIGLQLRFELLHNYGALNMHDQRQEELWQIWSYLLLAEDFAKFYRYLGSSAIDREELDTGLQYLLYSLYFEDSAAAHQELRYIDEQQGTTYAQDVQQPDTLAALIDAASREVAARGWAFAIGNAQLQALDQLDRYQQSAGGKTGSAAESLALYTPLLHPLPPAP